MRLPFRSIRCRASRRTRNRNEGDAPGDLLHIDVKKLGRIPDGGGWRIDGPDVIDHNRGRKKSKKLGMDRVHVAVDDHSRLAFARVLPDETGSTCAAFLLDAAAFFADHGITIREVMTDNAMNYRLSRDFQAALTALGAKHILTRPPSPCPNGKPERLNHPPKKGRASR